METNMGSKPQFRTTKLWIAAKRRPNRKLQQQTNLTVEALYNQMLKKAKTLSANDRKPVFERDYRYDKSDSLAVMHAFMSSKVYLLLECNYLYDYGIQYCFCGCQFEKEITDILTEFPLSKQATRVDLKPDYTNFYYRVLGYQDDRYITRRV